MAGEGVGMTHEDLAFIALVGIAICLLAIYGGRKPNE